MAEEMERHFGAQQIGKGRVGGIGVTAAGNALVAQVIEGIPCQQVFVIPQAQTSGCRGIDAQNQLADFGIGFALGLSLAVLRMECANEDAFVVPVYLRSFQAALLTLIRIWNLPFDKSINPLDRQQLLEDLFVAILHSTIQQKKGGHRYKWDDGKSYAQCSYSKRALAFTGYFLGFKFVEDYIFESTLNSENVVSTINTYVQNEITKPREKSYDPIQKTTQFWLMTDSAVEDLYNQLYECIGTHDYTLVELFKLLSFAYKLSEIGFAVDIDQFFQKVYNAVNNMEPLSKEDLRYLELSMFDGSFLSSDSPNYPIFRQQCDELMTLMKEKSHARDDTQIAVLLKENDGWGKKFYEYVSSNRNIFPSEKAFLSKFNIDALFEKLRFSPPDDWLAFRHSISLIYNFSNLSDFYQDDLEPAKMLKEKLENVVLPSKIVNNTHKAWLIESLQDIIEKLAPSKPQQ